MKRLILLIIGLTIALPGCSIYGNAVRNLFHDPLNFHYHLEEARDKKLHREWAEQAWNDIAACTPPPGYSEDHALGFQDGFADFLEFGGNGEPPPIPPRRYWRQSYQTPVGFRAIQEWYAGFRHGSNFARENGYREYVTIPSSMMWWNSLPTGWQDSPSPGTPLPPPANELPMPSEAPPKISAPSTMYRPGGPQHSPTRTRSHFPNHQNSVQQTNYYPHHPGHILEQSTGTQPTGQAPSALPIMKLSTSQYPYYYGTRR